MQVSTRDILAYRQCKKKIKALSFAIEELQSKLKEPEKLSVGNIRNDKKKLKRYIATRKKALEQLDKIKMSSRWSV